MFHVYGILNCINGKLYVGKTRDINERWLEHIRTANGGKRKYPRQFFAIHAAMIKYSISNFEIFCIQSFDDELIAYEAEKYWVKFFKTQDKFSGYNLAEGGKGSGSGENSPNFGLKRSELTKNKLRDSHLAEKNHNYKKEFSEKTKAAMSKAQKGNQTGEDNPKSVLTWEKVFEIRKLFSEGVGISELGRKFKVHKSNISYIVKYKTWVNYEYIFASTINSIR